MVPCSEYSADVGRARNSDALEGEKLDIIEGLFDEGAQVDLQVEPLVLYDHGRGNACVDVRPLYIVLATAEHLRCVEDQPLLLPILVVERDLKVELFLVGHEDLQDQVGLHQLQIDLPALIFGQAQLRRPVPEVAHEAARLLVVHLGRSAGEEPVLHGVFVCRGQRWGG